MGAGQEDLRAARFLPHVIDVGADTIAVAEAFAGNQFVAAQQRFCLTQFDHQVAVFGALDDTVDDLADAILELIVLLLALILADALHDHLLGGLRGDAAEVDWRQRIDDELADRFFRKELGRDRLAHLGFFVFDRLDDFRPTGQAHIAGLAVDRGADVLLMPVLGASGLLDGLFHGLQHFLAVDVLFARDGIGDQQQFGAGDSGVHGDLCECVWLIGQRRGGRRFDQGIGQDKFRASNVRKANQDFGPVIQPQARAVIICAKNDAQEALAAVLWEKSFDPRLMTGEPVPVLQPGQRPIDPGRTNFQRPGTGDRIVNVDRGADVVADLGAVFNGDLAAVGPIGHDLHRGALTAEHRDAHKLKAHKLQPRRDNRGQLAFQGRRL